MNRWEQIGDLLFDADTRLLRAGRARFSGEWKTLPGLLELLFHQEQLHRSAVDSLARQFSQTGSTPEAEDWDDYFLGQRLLNACDFLAQIMHEDSQGCSLIPQPDSAYTDVRLIEWLLTAMWQRRYDHWLKMVAMSVALDRPLYGLEDAQFPN